MQTSKIKKLVSIVVIILTISGLVTSVYYYNKYRTLKENPNLEAQKEIEALTAAIGKFMDLPTDETPTVATVLDKEKLKDQPFFTKAETGDKLLAYTKAMKAILYRPSTNRIIEVAPIYISQQEGVKQNEPISAALDRPVAPAGLRVAYYNGTETAGLSGQAEKIVKDAYPDYQTGVLTNAVSKDYKETLVIDLTGIHSQEAGDLAVLIGGRVSSLPNGENKPDADILIISGK